MNEKSQHLGRLRAFRLAGRPLLSVQEPLPERIPVREVKRSATGSGARRGTKAGVSKAAVRVHNSMENVILPSVFLIKRRFRKRGRRVKRQVAAAFQRRNRNRNRNRNRRRRFKRPFFLRRSGKNSAKGLQIKRVNPSPSLAKAEAAGLKGKPGKANSRELQSLVDYDVIEGGEPGVAGTKKDNLIVFFCSFLPVLCLRFWESKGRSTFKEQFRQRRRRETRKGKEEEQEAERGGGRGRR